MKSIPVIDLHGRVEDEVFDLLDRFIRHNKNQKKIKIITGKGQGVIQKKTLEYLKMAHCTWKYENAIGVANKGAILVDIL